MSGSTSSRPLHPVQNSAEQAQRRAGTAHLCRLERCHVIKLLLVPRQAGQPGSKRFERGRRCTCASARSHCWVEGGRRLAHLMPRGVAGQPGQGRCGAMQRVRRLQQGQGQRRV